MGTITERQSTDVQHRIYLSVLVGGRVPYRIRLSAFQGGTCTCALICTCTLYLTTFIFPTFTPLTSHLSPLTDSSRVVERGMKRVNLV